MRDNSRRIALSGMMTALGAVFMLLGGTILISRAVADALGDRAEVTSLGGSVPLKGKTEGFETLTLDALQR